MKLDPVRFFDVLADIDDRIIEPAGGTDDRNRTVA